MIKVLKTILASMLIMCAVVNISMPVYASGSANLISEERQFYSHRRLPEQLSAEQIMTELYANVNNPMMQDAAKTEAMLLTDEKPITTDQYGIRVGKYDIPTWPSAASPFGDTARILSLVYPHKDGSQEYALYAPVSAVPDAQKVLENRAALNLLYNTAWDLKETTLFMNDHDKSVAIADWLRANIKSKANSPKSPVSCLALGHSDCSGYSGLFEIFGSFCGLDTKQVAGRFRNDNHSWNMVNISETWLYLDVGWNENLIDHDTLLAHGYQISMISGDKADMLSTPTVIQGDSAQMQ